MRLSFGELKGKAARNEMATYHTMPFVKYNQALQTWLSDAYVEFATKVYIYYFDIDLYIINRYNKELDEYCAIYLLCKKKGATLFAFITIIITKESHVL